MSLAHNIDNQNSFIPGKTENMSVALLEEFKTLCKEMTALILEQHSDEIQNTGAVTMSFEFPYGKKANLMLEINDGMLSIVRN